MNEPKWRRYLRLIRPNAAADFDDELRDHLASTAEELAARGMSPEAARVESRRRFGDVDRVRAEVNQLDARHATSTRRTAALESFVYDLRHAARGLRRSPAFMLVAALSIGLGVAANSTVFSVVNAVLLRPIPGVRADRLVRVYVNHHSPFDWSSLSWFRERATSFEYLVGERYGATSFRVASASEAERVRMSYVTQGFFPALGVRMALGQGFDSDERTGAGTAPVAVLSHPFWQRRFAGDSSIIGRTIVVSERPVTIVGVTAPDFRSSVMGWTPEVFVPFSAAPVLTGRSLEDFNGSFYTTARLGRGMSNDAAEGELHVLMRQLALTDTVRYERTTVRLDHVRGVNAELRQAVTAGSVFLMAMVALVLLIACVNVANLLLGRAAARRTEIGVRLAIGASRGRLVRQLLTESLLVATIGGAVGLATAWALTRVLPGVIPPEAGIDAEFFAPDMRVLLFTGALCLMTTLVFGGLPSFRAASPRLVALIKGGEEHERRVRRRGWLVTLQTAMCVVLLAVAALFLRSLSSLRVVDPGFQADGIVDVGIDLDLAGARLDSTKTLATFATIVRDAKLLPGVQAAAVTQVVPLSGTNMETRVLPQEMTVASRSEAPGVYFHVVSAGWFSLMHIPIQRGREFAESDGPSAPRVAVISETAARRLWPSGDALGKRFHWGSVDGPLLEVVGIAREANYAMPGEAPKAVVYVPAAQEVRSDMTLQLRTTASVAVTRRAVWEMLRSVVPNLPPPPVTTMSDDMAVTLLPVRIGAGLLGAFGALALLLAAAGIYGVASYSVARRTREIGVRAALGASRGRLVRMVLWESGRHVGVGAAIGFLLTIGVAAALSSVLYGVRPLDVPVLTSVALTIGVIALLATIAPARRAARADPVSAMRSE